MIFKPASPVKCSTSGCNSSHISTSGKGNRTATSFRPNNSNFFVDFFAHLWYFSAIAALLSKKSSHPGLYPSPGREPLLFSSQISTKSGATSLEVTCKQIRFLCLSIGCTRQQTCTQV